MNLVVEEAIPLLDTGFLGQSASNFDPPELEIALVGPYILYRPS